MSTTTTDAAALVKQLVANKPTDNTLYTLADVSTVRAWNYELPTLTTKGRFTARTPWNSTAEFAEAFYQKFPLFKGIDMSNIALMGGAPFDFLHDRSASIADLDLFLVGDLEGDAEDSTMEQKVIRRAEKFIDDVYAYLDAYVKEKNQAYELAEKNGTNGKRRLQQQSLSTLLQQFKATRSGPVITFTIPTVDVAVQLVLAAPRSVQDLLRRADLDCTAIAFVDGKELYFNSISKFCYENACAIICNSCNDQFESRIAKYFSQKGIDIIMPQLNISAIPQRNLRYKVEEVLDLSRMAVVYSEVTLPGKIITSRIIPNADLGVASSDAAHNARKLCSPGSSTGGGYRGGGCKSVKNAGVVIHENIIHLLHGYTGKFQYYGEGKYVKDVLLPIPKLTNRMITNSFETVREKLDAFKSGAVDVVLLEKYFVARPISAIIDAVVMAPLRKREAAAMSAMSAVSDDGPYSAMDHAFTEGLKAYFDELIPIQITQTCEKLAAVEKDYAANPDKFKIVSEIPFQDLDASTWYGEAYITK